MNKIYLYNIRRIDDSFMRSCLGELPVEERNRAFRYRFDKDRKLYIAGKTMARKVIASLFGVKAEKIEFQADEFDRPLLKYPNRTNFDFNISHSGDYAVLAVSDGRIGVDIERIKPTDQGVARDCFHEKEIEYLHEPEQGRLDRFFRVWTLKEAFVKYIGQGLSYPLKKFYFCFAGNAIKLYFSDNGRAPDCSFRNIKTDDNHMMSICFEGDSVYDIDLIDFNLK